MGRTLKELRDDIKDQLDMNEDEWLNDSQLNSDINVAIRKAHRKIVTIYEDYFLAEESQAIASEQNSLTYPADIYANKIRTVTFTDAPVGFVGSSSYEISSVRDLKAASQYEKVNSSTANRYNKWIPYSSSSSHYMKLVPNNGDSGHVSIWYIRKPRTLVNDDDVCDIPEFDEYVVQVVKTKFYRLDGDPRYRVEKAEEIELEESMINTLTNMKPDENTLIQEDRSFYYDSI